MQVAEVTYLVRSCPNHGTIEAPDLTSAEIYAMAARECEELRRLDREHHEAWHRSEGHECYVCCDSGLVF